jgi:hypothetical protein
MGFAYANDALILIVADHNGLTKEEIFEINEETYRANFGKHFDKLTKGASWQRALFIESRDEKYYLKKGTDMKRLQDICRLGAQIGYNFHGHKPSFWKGEIQAE